MDTVIMPKADWTAALDATRKKGGTTALLKSGELAQAIRDIPTGGPAPVIQPLSVTENGDYTAPPGVDGYSPVSVNVPSGGGDNDLNGFVARTATIVRAKTLLKAGKTAAFQYEGLKEFHADVLEEVESAFRWCGNLSIFEAPNLKTITGVRSFERTGFEKFELPKLFLADGLRDTLSFNQCEKLLAFIVRPDYLVNLPGTGVFGSTPIAAGTGYIYVPRALVDQYKAATNWVTYAAQIRAIEDYPDITGG